MENWGSLSPDERDGVEDGENRCSDTEWTGGTVCECRICGEQKRCHRHHTSYEPEKTKKVCNDCHYKIHNVDGFYDHLNPFYESDTTPSFPGEGELYDIPKDVPGAPDRR